MPNALSDAFSFAPAWAVFLIFLVSAVVVAWLLHAAILVSCAGCCADGGLTCNRFSMRPNTRRGSGCCWLRSPLRCRRRRSSRYQNHIRAVPGLGDYLPARLDRDDRDRYRRHDLPARFHLDVDDNLLARKHSRRCVCWFAC